MRNDLSTFEFDLLTQLIFNGNTSIPPLISERLRNMGYAERVFSETRASDLGRARFLIGLPIDDRQKSAYERLGRRTGE